MKPNECDFRYCMQCLTPNTMAYVMGRALSYAKTKYGYTPTEVEAIALRLYFVKNPFCMWTRRKGSKSDYLVFYRIHDDKPVCPTNLMLLLKSYTRFDVRTRFTIKSVRLARECMEIAHRELTERR